MMIKWKGLRILLQTIRYKLNLRVQHQTAFEQITIRYELYTRRWTDGL